jgi:hypothetical protein
VPRPLCQAAAIGGALPERLEGRQPLDGIEEFRAEALHRLVPGAASAALHLVPRDRCDQRDQGRDQHDYRDRQIPPHDEQEDRDRRQRGDTDLRQVLAEKALQLLDAVDQRQHDPAGALAGEPGRSQFGDLVVEPAAQILLDAAGGVVSDDGPAVVEEAAQQDGERHADGRQRNRGGAGAGEDARQQGAEQREPGDPKRRSGKADRDGQEDAASQSARQLP